MKHIPKFIHYWLILSLAILAVFCFACDHNPTYIILPSPFVDHGTYDVSPFNPVAKGNRWIYFYDNGAEKAILERCIIDSQEIEKGVALCGYSEVVQTNPPDTLRPISGFLGNSGGTLFIASVALGKYYDAVPYLCSPIIAGHTWTSTLQSRQDSFQIVSVAPALFAGQMIDTVVTVRRWNASLVDSVSFGRGVGLLRQISYRAPFLTIRELQSFDIVD